MTDEEAIESELLSKVGAARAALRAAEAALNAHRAAVCGFSAGDVVEWVAGNVTRRGVVASVSHPSAMGPVLHVQRFLLSGKLSNRLIKVDWYNEAKKVDEEAIDPPWYLNEQTRETGERWPEPCECFVNLDPDDYPDQPGCDRCGWAKQDHR
jgi:hypothetical protein